MSRFSPFRVSFEHPIGSRERVRARVAATLVGAAVLFVGSAGVLALLNASSGAIGKLSNASPVTDVRTVEEGVMPSGKACEDQTWPYIEPRCLKQADPQSAERSTPRHGLSSKKVALPQPAKQPTTKTAASAEERGTTGAATPRETAEPSGSETSDAVKAALAPSRDAVPTGSIASAPQAETPAARVSPREQRRVDQDTRKRVQRERREQARRVAERNRARQAAREARRNRDERWGEYSYGPSFGPNRDAMVIRRGSMDDDFFRGFR